MKKNKLIFKDNSLNQEIWAIMPVLVSFVKFTSILKQIRKEIKEEEESSKPSQ